MGSKQHVIADFYDTRWRTVNDIGTEIKIGNDAGKAAPYDLLLGALSGCLYTTFESILEKMQITVKGTRYDIHGEKRDDKIATLKECHVNVTVVGAEDEQKTKKAMEIATRYCSIYQTLSKVAEMSWEVAFEK